MVEGEMVGVTYNLFKVTFFLEKSNPFVVLNPLKNIGGTLQ
jgi:hypothetical protein